MAAILILMAILRNDASNLLLCYWSDKTHSMEHFPLVAKKVSDNVSCTKSQSQGIFQETVTVKDV